MAEPKGSGVIVDNVPATADRRPVDHGPAQAVVVENAITTTISKATADPANLKNSNLSLWDVALRLDHISDQLQTLIDLAEIVVAAL